MARNFVQPGNILTAVAGVGGVKSGTIQVIGSIVGVAATGAPEGEEYELDVCGGVFEVAKSAGAAWLMGDPVYYDPATKSVTKTAGSLKKIGVAAQSAAPAAAIGVVRFNRDFV